MRKVLRNKRKPFFVPLRCTPSSLMFLAAVHAFAPVSREQKNS
jgi:hypothetical protein